MDSTKLFKGADRQAYLRAVDIASFAETITYHEKNPVNYTVDFETGVVSGGDTAVSLKVFIYRFQTEDGRPDTSGGLNEADGMIWVDNAQLDTNSIKMTTRDWFGDSEAARCEILSVSDVQTETTCATFRRTS